LRSFSNTKIDFLGGKDNRGIIKMTNAACMSGIEVSEMCVWFRFSSSSGGGVTMVSCLEVQGVSIPIVDRDSSHPSLRFVVQGSWTFDRQLGSMQPMCQSRLFHSSNDVV